MRRGSSTLSQVAAQVVALQCADEVVNETPAELALASDPLGRLGQLFSEFLKLRQLGRELLMELSPEAARILLNFSREQASRSLSLSPREQRFARNTILIAAKIAGCVQVLSPQRTKPISGDVMDKAVRMAARWSADTAKLAEILIEQRKEAELAQTAQKMLEFLIDSGKTKRWPLWKKFDHHPKSIMEPALEILVRSGRARRHPDGSIEAVDNDEL